MYGIISLVADEDDKNLKKFLRKIKKDTYAWVFILFLAVSALDNAFFGAIIEGQYISLSILVRVIYAVVVPAVLARKTERKK